jgi:hypothetical protein
MSDPVGFLTWFDVAMVPSIAVGTAKAFDWFEGALSPAAKQSVAQWLSNPGPPNKSEGEVGVLSGVIDRVFGTRPFSVRFILKSCLFSVFASLVTGLVFFRNSSPSSVEASGTIFEFLVSVSLASIVLNLLPNYVSLLICRWTVRLISRQPSVLRIINLLFLNAILNVAAAASGLLLGTWFLNYADLMDLNPPIYDGPADAVKQFFLAGLPLHMTITNYTSKEFLVRLKEPCRIYHRYLGFGSMQH